MLESMSGIKIIEIGTLSRKDKENQKIIDKKA